MLKKEETNLIVSKYKIHIIKIIFSLIGKFACKDL